MFNNEDNENIGRSIIFDEMVSALKYFARDKSPSLNSWPVELFLHFMYIMGHDLRLLDEESRTSYLISSAVNSTFIALVYKG